LPYGFNGPPADKIGWWFFRRTTSTGWQAFIYDDTSSADDKHLFTVM
ncbi:MAG: hypothetical protein ACI80F_002250, partial [Natronomonas sp.]